MIRSVVGPALLGGLVGGLLMFAPIGCGRVSPEPEPQPAPPSACRGWTALANGVCAPRTVSQPELFRAVGPEGARPVNMALDDSGRIVVTMVATDGARSRVFVGEESSNGSAFVVREPGAAFVGMAGQPTVSAGPGRRATVAWKQEERSDLSRIFVSERDESGAWVDPQTEADAFSFLPRAYDPYLHTAAKSGEVLFAWNQWVDPNYRVLVARKKRDGQWERPSAASDALSFPYFYSNSPRIAATGSGDVLVSWYQAAPGEFLMAFVSERRGEDGAFSRSSGSDYVSPGGGDVGGSGGGSPRPALGPNDEAACAWLQKNAEGRLVPYLAARAAGGEWSKPSREDALGLPGGNADSVRLAFAAGGTLIVAWTHDDGSGPGLYALRRKPDGTWRDDPRAPLRLSAPGLKAIAPALVTSASGAIAIAWIDISEQGSALRLRRSWDGDETWGELETVADFDKRADAPVLAFGPRGRLALGWTEGIVKSRVHMATIE